MEQIKKNRLTLNQAKSMVDASIRDIKDGFVIVGCYLRIIREDRLWEKYYSSFREFLEANYEKDKSWASRCISLYEQFGKEVRPGELPELAEPYRDYSASQLIEMVSMTEEQRQQVTPDMPVRQIRGMKPKREKEAGIQAEEPATEPEEEQIPGQMEITEYPGVAATSQQDGPAQRTAEEEQEEEPEEGQEEEITDCQEEVATSQLPEPEASEGQQDSSAGLSAYGTPARVYPEGSLTAAAGCEGGMYYCSSCAMDCGIRQEARQCRYATMASPFPCGQMEKLGELGQDGSCQFMEHGLAYHAPGSGTAEPCCMECGNICGDACQRALAGILQDGTEPEESAPNDQETGTEDPETGTQDQETGTEAGNTGKEPEKSVIDTDSVEVPEAAPEPPAAYDRRKLEEMIRKAEEMMKTVEAHRDEVGPDFYTKHAMQLEAYRNLLEAYEGQEAAGREPEEETVPVQPELPVLKNNDQRKAWLRNYRDWGLWYEDRNIGAKYYRYIFGNGAVLIVDEYQHGADGIVPEYTSSFLHLVGGPKPGMNQSNGCSMWPYHKRYCRHSDSESELVEFLKALQRKGKQKR